jgi:hypothetical protein
MSMKYDACMGKIRRAWLAAALCLSVSLAQAADQIGFVKSVTGDASVVTEGKATKAKIGLAVFEGSVLKTTAGSSMGVTFKDDTVMSFGPNTELVVDQYLFNPAQGKLKLNAKLARGSLNYVSGAIAKLQPEVVSVNTPVGTIGVRGTQFVVAVEEE